MLYKIFLFEEKPKHCKILIKFTLLTFLEKTIFYKLMD